MVCHQSGRHQFHTAVIESVPSTSITVRSRAAINQDRDRLSEQYGQLEKIIGAPLLKNQGKSLQIAHSRGTAQKKKNVKLQQIIWGHLSYHILYV